MKAIDKRLQKLENFFAPRVEKGADWGSLAGVRDEILGRAEQLGELHATEIRGQLETLGPLGLWLEVVRSYLRDNGFVQTDDESFAETMARVLGIGTDQLRILIAQGQIASALLESFGEVR